MVPSMIARRSQFIAKRKVSLAIGIIIGIKVVDLLCGDIAKMHKHSCKLNDINKKKASEMPFLLNISENKVIFVKSAVIYSAVA